MRIDGGKELLSEIRFFQYLQWYTIQDFKKIYFMVVMVGLCVNLSYLEGGGIFCVQKLLTNILLK